MEIGNRLKNARIEMGLTQEKVAEDIGVSRQTVYNWENGRCYPDIVNVIKLSDLYSVSLDELLKEDKNMIRHLKESTDVVKSRQKISRLIITLCYWGFWIVMIALNFVLSALAGNGFNGFASGYGFFERVIFPIVLAGIALLMGLNGDYGFLRWIYIPVTGIMMYYYASFCVLTPDLPTSLHAPFLWVLLGLFASGVIVGALIRIFRFKFKISVKLERRSAENPD